MEKFGPSQLIFVQPALNLRLSLPESFFLIFLAYLLTSFMQQRQLPCIVFRELDPGPL